MVVYNKSFVHSFVGEGGDIAADQSRTLKNSLSAFFEDANRKVSKFLSFRKTMFKQRKKWYKNTSKMILVRM